MNAILAALITFVIANYPAIASDVQTIVAEFKKGHPELADPPAEDAEATLNASFDAQLKARGEA